MNIEGEQQQLSAHFVGTWQLKEINGKGILPPLQYIIAWTTMSESG